MRFLLTYKSIKCETLHVKSMWYEVDAHLFLDSKK